MNEASCCSCSLITKFVLRIVFFASCVTFPTVLPDDRLSHKLNVFPIPALHTYVYGDLIPSRINM